MCYCRIGASRQEFLNRRDAACREIRQVRRLRQCYKVRTLKYRSLSEAWTTGLSPIFNLGCPDIKLIETIIDRPGPGKITEYLALFDVDTPNPEDAVDNVSALAVHAFDFGRRFNNAETISVSNCPLVFDTGTSTGISHFNSDVLKNYKMSHWCQRNCRSWLNYGRWYHFTEVYYSTWH